MPKKSSESVSERGENLYLCFCFIIYSMYLRTLFRWCKEKSNLLKSITKVNQKFMRRNVTWPCFKFWPMIKIFWKSMSQQQFDYELYTKWVVSKIRTSITRNFSASLFKVSYLPWQNICSNIKTTGHIKSKFVLWTKLLQNLLLAKYLIYVAATLKNLNTQKDEVFKSEIHSKKKTEAFFNVRHFNQIVTYLYE